MRAERGTQRIASALLLLALAAACAAAAAPPDMALSLQLLTRPAGRLWSSYCQQLERRPLLSRVATGVVGTIISDALAQHTAATMAGGRRRKHDFGRTARLVVWSALAGTPIAYKWFAYLDRVRAGRSSPRRAAAPAGAAASSAPAPGRGLRRARSHAAPPGGPPPPARPPPPPTSPLPCRPSCRTAPPTPRPCS
jgi:hypothetical protein